MPKSEENVKLKDQVLILFKKMGFDEINSENIKINEKKIDIMLKDENHLFIIFCIDGVEDNSLILNKEINDISNLKIKIIEKIRKNYSDNNLKTCFLLVTNNLELKKEDLDLAREKKIFLWKDSDLEAYKILLQQLGMASKYQMYSILFFGEKNKSVSKIEIPAIYGGKGKKKYYCFIIQPKKLFPIAYIHRREKSPEGVSLAYQRLVNRLRLDKIDSFIKEGNFFPNNVIINFTHPPEWKKKARVGDITYGLLKFPPYYGSAWIIDGQHRLFGYCNTKRAESDTLPVVAFNSLSTKDQAKLFVDINKEQKAVPSNLLWDLYPDLYDGSDDPKQRLLCHISLMAKKLNFEDGSFFKGLINIPSIINKDNKKFFLTLETICKAIQKNKLIDERDGLFHYEDYETSINLAYKIVNSYFEQVFESLKIDGDLDLRKITNIKIRIFFTLFRQIIRYLDYRGEKEVYLNADLTNFKKRIKEFLNPLSEKLINMSKEERIAFFGGVGEKFVMNTSKQIAWWIKEKTHESFAFEILKRWAPQTPTGVTDEMIRTTLEETERSLREWIMQKLKENLGERWWKDGVNGDVKKTVKEKIEKQIEKEVWRTQELLSLDPERKFIGFTDTPCLHETIKLKNNWVFFKQFFMDDKEITHTRFKDFEFIRNKYQHFAEHELSKVSKNLGFWAMIWIMECVGLEIPEEVLNLK